MRTPLLDRIRELISLQWKYRNDYFGVRMMLRSMIRQARKLRDEQRST